MSHYKKCEYIKTNSLKKRIKSIVSFIIYRICLLWKPKRPICKLSKNSVAIVFLASLGDLVVLCDVAKKIKESGKRITLICKRNNGTAEFARITNVFNQIIELDIKGINRFSNIRLLKELEYDYVFCAPLGRHILPDIYACAIKANMRFFPDTMLDCTSLHLKSIIDKRADKLLPINETHEQKRYTQFLKGCNLINEDVGTFYLDNTICSRNRTLAILPGAGGGMQKQWSVDNFAYIAEMLTQKRTISNVVILGTDNEKKCCAQLYDKISNSCDVNNLCGITDMAELIRILSGCCLALANDSGGAHISIACHTPTIVLCGMWQYARFYPNHSDNTHISIFARKKFCQSCYNSTPLCNISPAPCVSNIDKNLVLKYAEKLLGRTNNV